MGTETASLCPDISLVVASFSDAETLARCLESIAKQEQEAEVIVVSNTSAKAHADVMQRFPSCRFIHAARNADVFHLRTMGALRARGRIVVFTEDHCVAGTGWLSALRKAYQQGRKIVGGSVDSGLTKGSFDWSLYLCEYARYMPSRADGATSSLSGVNVAYDRELLDSCCDIWQPAMYENELHDALRGAGHQLRFVNTAQVCSGLAMTLRQAVVHLFTGGLHFGTYRQSRSSPLRRLFWLAAVTAVPMLLMQRIVGQVAVRQPERLVHLTWALPYLVLLVGSWSLGEAVGHVRATVNRRVVHRSGGPSHANWR